MKREKGFTIIETIIALTVLGLIAFSITMIDSLKKSYNQKNIHAVDFQLWAESCYILGAKSMTKSMKCLKMAE